MMPAIGSGVIWAFAFTGAMICTDSLGQSTGVPITLNGAFIVNCSWAVFYYREIRGRHNLTLFGAAAALNIAGSLLITVSKTGLG